MNWHATGGKSGLMRMLMKKHGFSKRKAEKAVNMIFDGMTRALWRGEVVEIPGGEIVLREREGKRRIKYQEFSNIQTRKREHKVIWYKGKRKVVKFIPDETLDLTPPPRPPDPQLVSKAMELEQLLLQLIHGKISSADRDWLLDVVARSCSPGTPPPELLTHLLARLRELVKRGRQFTDSLELSGGVRMLHWL